MNIVIQILLIITKNLRKLDFKILNSPDVPVCWESVRFQNQEDGHNKFVYLDMIVYGCECMCLRFVFAVYLKP